MVTMARVLPDFNVQWEEFEALLDQWRMDDPRRLFKSLVTHDRWRTSYWVLRQINRMGDEAMARGTKKPVQTNGSGKQQWTTFVEISLAGHTLAKIDDAIKTPDDIYDGVTNMLAEGYRISLSYNAQNDAIIASVTCKDESSVNAGCTFTSFANDWPTALKVCVYKHYFVTKEVWKNVGEAPERPIFG